MTSFSPTQSLEQKLGGLAIKSLVTFLVFINAFSGIIGGIWLAFLGQWGIILAGFLYSFVMPWVYTIVSLPNFGIAMLLGKAVEKKNKFFTVTLGFVAALYTYAVLSLWVFFVFGNFVLDAVLRNFVPLLLWGYSTVMAPLSYMASKEDEGSGSGLGLLFSQVVYLIMTIIWFFGIQGGFALFLLVAPAIGVSLFAVSLALQGLRNQEVQDSGDSLPVIESTVVVGEDEDPLYSDAKQIVLESGKASASVLQQKLGIGYARAARLLDILEEAGVIDRPPAQEYENSRNDEPTEGLYDDAVKVAKEYGRVSPALLQKELRIGYAKAAVLLDLMEEDGIIGEADGNKPRKLL